MGEETLEHAMRICIEGPEHLTDETLEAKTIEVSNIKNYYNNKQMLNKDL